MLRQGDLRSERVGQCVSAFGDGVTAVVLSFVVLDPAGSGTGLSIVLACQSIPFAARD